MKQKGNLGAFEHRPSNHAGTDAARSTGDQ
jgi:hypothetical protein